MTRPRPERSTRVSAVTPIPIRTELLLTLGALLAAAVLTAVCVVALAAGLSDASMLVARLGWTTAVVIGFVVVVAIALAAVSIRRLVWRPLRDLADAATALAAGDLSRRAPRRLGGDLARVANALDSLSERIATEQGQRARAEQLASVGRLAASIAHEIGNPLGAINGYAYMLGSRLGHLPELSRAAEGIERESDRIDRIVRGLLDYARPRMLTPTSIDVNDVARSAVSILRAQGVLGHLRIREELDDTTPTLHGERHQLEQMFINLLLNAADAVPAGGEILLHTERLPRAALEDGAVRRANDPPFVMHPRDPAPGVGRWLAGARPPAEVLSIVVADSGPGVPPEQRDRIFEPFVSSKGAGKGTGLGLAIVSSVVEQFGGTIWVGCAREGGAAFHLLFPVAVGLGAPLRRDRLAVHR